MKNNLCNASFDYTTRHIDHLRSLLMDQTGQRISCMFASYNADERLERQPSRMKIREIRFNYYRGQFETKQSFSCNKQNGAGSHANAENASFLTRMSEYPS
jgi:hypothetical protein